MEKRSSVIIKTSVVGILANILLAIFKAAVGLISNSIAVILDAVNNLSDAAGSIITIVGTKLSKKAPDRKHPFGHGRIEYLSAMIISVIVLYAGLTSLTESVKKIINPEIPDYSSIAVIIISASVIVKILLGIYVKKTGERVNSSSLINSGKDALLDSVISLATLVSAIIFLLSGVKTEAYLGAVISIVIIKSGFDMLREAISEILGERADRDLALSIKETVCSFPDVSGAYDLVLNNYGPDAFNGSLHIEVPDTYSADMLDELIRAITIEVLTKHNVILTAIGVYSINTKDEEISRIRNEIKDLVMENEYALQVHGFFLNREKKTIRFDTVISFDAKDKKEVYRDILRSVKERYPEYTYQIALDTDFTES